MGQACGTHCRGDKYKQVCVEFVKEIDDLEDIVSDGRKMLREKYKKFSQNLGQICFPENSENF